MAGLQPSALHRRATPTTSRCEAVLTTSQRLYPCISGRPLEIGLSWPQYGPPDIIEFCSETSLPCIPSSTYKFQVKISTMPMTSTVLCQSTSVTAHRTAETSSTPESMELFNAIVYGGGWSFRDFQSTAHVHSPAAKDIVPSAIMMSLSQFKKEANWFMVYYLSVVHLGALEGLRRLFSCKWETFPLFVFIYYLTGLGITMGAHRLWAHRSYKAHGIVRFFLMLCNCMANQGTIFHWSRDHRVHHKYSDTVADPHDSGRGFFFAHMGWLLVKKDPRVLEAGTKLNYDDLWADWTVVVQEKLNPWGNLFMCFVFPTIVGVQTIGEDWKNALFILGFLRYVAVLHATWLVNSAAHFYGYQTYDNIPPRENWFVSLWAIGEGWHNWHHKFPYDYATSEFGATAQFNPTKLTIDFMALLGLVTDRKRATEIWSKIKESKEKGSKFQDPNGDDPTQAFSELKAKAN